ncbi:hypothetical protein JCM8097_008531 [Rhodosporidiobolus ruineniae]
MGASYERSYPPAPRRPYDPSLSTTLSSHEAPDATLLQAGFADPPSRRNHRRKVLTWVIVVLAVLVVVGVGLGVGFSKWREMEDNKKDGAASSS